MVSLVGKYLLAQGFNDLSDEFTASVRSKDFSSPSGLGSGPTAGDALAMFADVCGSSNRGGAFDGFIAANPKAEAIFLDPVVMFRAGHMLLGGLQNVGLFKKSPEMQSAFAGGESVRRNSDEKEAVRAQRRLEENEKASADLKARIARDNELKKLRGQVVHANESTESRVKVLTGDPDNVLGALERLGLKDFNECVLFVNLFRDGKALLDSGSSFAPLEDIAKSVSRLSSLATEHVASLMLGNDADLVRVYFTRRREPSTELGYPLHTRDDPWFFPDLFESDEVAMERFIVDVANEPQRSVALARLTELEKSLSVEDPHAGPFQRRRAESPVDALRQVFKHVQSAFTRRGE